MAKKKIKDVFVLDTSVLIADPYAINTFQNSEIIIPVAVLEELDKLKKSSGEAGRNARLAIRELDSLSERGDAVAGIKLESGIVFKIDAVEHAAIGQDASYGDSKILGCAAHAKSNCTSPVILVSNDINLRVRAKAAGLLAQPFHSKSTSTLELYKGYKEVTSNLLGKELQRDGLMELTRFRAIAEFSLNENEFVLINSQAGEGLAIGRRIDDFIHLVKTTNPWGLAPRNKEQSFLIDLLMDTKIPLVSVIGKAGSGKSLLSMACCLDLVLEKKAYKKLIICRPIQVIGSEIGFLPGDVGEKLEPYYRAISDAFAQLFGNKSSKAKPDAWKDYLYQYMDSGIIQYEPVTYMRGRSIPNALILIDESQNLSQEEIKAILTRAGEGTKIILNGDIEQIDNNYLDASNNGLTHIIDKFKESHIAGHITLTKGERSELATIASEIL